MPMNSYTNSSKALITRCLEYNRHQMDILQFISSKFHPLSRTHNILSKASSEWKEICRIAGPHTSKSNKMGSNIYIFMAYTVDQRLQISSFTTTHNVKTKFVAPYLMRFPNDNNLKNHFFLFLENIKCEYKVLTPFQHEIIQNLLKKYNNFYGYNTNQICNICYKAIEKEEGDMMQYFKDIERFISLYGLSMDHPIKKKAIDDIKQYISIGDPSIMKEAKLKETNIKKIYKTNKKTGKITKSFKKHINHKAFPLYSNNSNDLKHSNNSYNINNTDNINNKNKKNNNFNLYDSSNDRIRSPSPPQKPSIFALTHKNIKRHNESQRVFQQLRFNGDWKKFKKTSYSEKKRTRKQQIEKKVNATKCNFNF